MSTPEVNDSRARLNALRNLLVTRKASTQEGIREALEKLNFDVNQSTISRDLRRLGAIKVVDSEGKTTYRLNNETSPVLATRIGDLIYSIKHNGAMIVINTPPGSASLVARHIDDLRSPQILGTIAGDDTTFVAPASVKKITEVVKLLQGSWA